MDRNGRQERFVSKQNKIRNRENGKEKIDRTVTIVTMRMLMHVSLLEFSRGVDWRDASYTITLSSALVALGSVEALSIVEGGEGLPLWGLPSSILSIAGAVSSIYSTRPSLELGVDINCIEYPAIIASIICSSHSYWYNATACLSNVGIVSLQ